MVRTGTVMVLVIAAVAVNFLEASLETVSATIAVLANALTVNSLVLVT